MSEESLNKNKLTCAQALHELPEFLDGKLDFEAAQRMRGHLDHCTTCGLVVRSAQDTLSRILDGSTENRTLRSAHAA